MPPLGGKGGREKQYWREMAKGDIHLCEGGRLEGKKKIIEQGEKCCLRARGKLGRAAEKGLLWEGDRLFGNTRREKELSTPKEERYA